MIRAAVCVAALTLAFPCLAQDDRAQQPFKLTVDAQLVLIDASVTDRKTGAILYGLQPADFALSEDGAPQTVAWWVVNRLSCAS